MTEFETATIDVAFTIKFQRGTEPPEPDDFAAMVQHMLDGDTWQERLGGGMFLLPMTDWYGDDNGELNGLPVGLAGITDVRALGYTGD